MWGQVSQSSTPPTWQAAAQHFDFRWHLSGDAEVAPLQVFAGSHEVWLQFASGQAWPAIFGLGPSGEQPLPYSRREPYAVVAGQWQTLIMRGGHHVAYARKVSQDEPAAVAVTSASPQPVPPVEPEIPVPAPSATASPVFFAGPPDGTLRAVLARWAAQAGWTFAAEHWVLSVDIPLQGQARFEGDFKTAVRELLRSIELADRPAQPCFYANQVLRVVPLAQSCDRSRGASA
ncbi:TcpQ domain-containing protein [Bordetella holmesii]|uniref:TcpQ domain-containing protein n=1 Tax=Bordetella holmesii TaxID=35814 RepID=UPI0009B84210|nr:TcpQ domain-containing protein [Bordetella holmesii]